MANEDSTVWVTFNGEIYNYKQLRSELQGYGHHFKSQSDTEVIVHAWEQWGNQCVNRFRGMFAFVLVDTQKRIFFAARDPLGIKPLVYKTTPQGVFFASEIRALAEVPTACTRGRVDSVELFLRYQHIPAPLTIYNDIFKLLPGHSIECAIDKPEVHPSLYWKMTWGENKHQKLEEWIDEFDATIDESVSAHLVADVPFGIFLSGGLDSTCTARSMARFTEEPRKAFCLEFDKTENSETPYASKVAKELGFVLDVKSVEKLPVDILGEVLHAYGEPFADSSAIPTWIICKHAAEYVPMVLSGDGGDELFGGYQSYLNWMGRHDDSPTWRMAYGQLRRGNLNAFWRMRKDLITREGTPRSQKLIDWFAQNECISSTERKQLWQTRFQTSTSNTHPFVDLALATELSKDELNLAQGTDLQTFLPDGILTKVDVASMAHGLEVRPPFLDLSVANFVSALPPDLRVHGQRHTGRIAKFLIKKSLERQFKSDFTNRPKFGFGMPLSENYLPPQLILLEFLLQNLSDFFVPNRIQELVLAKLDKPSTIRVLWTLYVLACWKQRNPHVKFE